MSYDLKIQNVCDHLLNWEEATLGSDYKTITLKYPIAAKSSVNLRINNIIIDRNKYVIINTTYRNTIEPATYIYMNRKIRLFAPFIEVQYTTYNPYCPKCLSVNVLDDVTYNNYGDFVTASDELELVQNVEKYIVTKITSNKFQPWIGTSLQSLIGTKITDLDSLKSLVLDQVNQAIDKLKNIQSQLVSSGTIVTDGETFHELISLDLVPQDDPTIVSVVIVFTAKSGRTLEYEQYLQLSSFRANLAR